MILDRSAFVSFCEQLRIPSKDQGLVPFRFFGTQTYWLDEVIAGLEAGVHDFVTLKGGRQIGGSTIADALAVYWPQANDGTQGQLVSDDDENRDYRRDLLLGMNESLPKAYRLPMRLNNMRLAAWPNGSRLSFRAAGKRRGSSLGRSRGISFLHADEVGSWPDERAVMSLRAALSENNPRRLYLWNSTAQGIGTPFHDMWNAAQTAVTSRAIFVAWWRHERYVVERGDARWARYGRQAPVADERLWIAAVKERYGVEITPEQLAWYRWKLTEDMMGDETMMQQEFACLPEDAFQSFGTKFISPHLVRRLRLSLPYAPKPHGYDYEFLDTLDETAERGLHEAAPEDASLIIWQEPEPDGVYVVAGHPQYSSSEYAGQFVAEVFRVWPDRMVQVAEYVADQGAMYQFAWVLLHLAGAYRTFIPAYFILEVAGTGKAVLAQIQLLERYGYGLSPKARGKVQDFLGSVRHYFYQRPDAPFGRTLTQEWQTQAGTRAWVLHGLRDTIERRQLDIRSPELLDNLSALRQGETGDQDLIAAGSKVSDSLALCTALAVECWLRTAMPDLEGLVAPHTPGRSDPTSVQQRIVQGYLGNILTRGGRA